MGKAEHGKLATCGQIEDHAQKKSRGGSELEGGERYILSVLCTGFILYFRESRLTRYLQLRPDR